MDSPYDDEIWKRLIANPLVVLPAANEILEPQQAIASPLILDGEPVMVYNDADLALVTFVIENMANGGTAQHWIDVYNLALLA